MQGLVKRLTDEGLIDPEVLETVVDQAKSDGVTIIKGLLTTTHIASATLARFVADTYGIPLFDLKTMAEPEFDEQLVPVTLIRKHGALPLWQRGNKIFLGVADPTNKSAIDDFKFATGASIETVVVEHALLEDSIDSVMARYDQKLALITPNFEFDQDFADKVQEASIASESHKDEQADESPIITFIDRILMDTTRQGASDIHFEPYEHEYRVRMRSDGVLYEIARPPKGLALRLAARLKIMANLNIAERRIPQDGRIQLKLSKHRAVDFRVSTLPTLFGEKIVLRILDSDSARIGIDVLGYEPEQKELFVEALNRPQGMILVTGPTGSGKTVSLYTGLDILNEPERNISTAEDPVEINMEGINQVHVNPKIGLDFAQVLRSFLRQDPDVLMVGEIRDLETAEIAIKAAQTGHLVLSTVHTNSAPETINRLLNMGVPAYNIASSLTLIIAQRLARRLCRYCAEPEKNVPESALRELGFTDELLKDANIMKPVGCKQCRKGYSGRVGIYEVVKIDKSLSSAILNGANVLELEAAADAAGFDNLRKSALKKCADGIISLEEVNRVTVD